MEDEKKFCTSCKRSITNDSGAVEFKCPKCGKTTIVRCSQCRIITTRYHCSNCGFKGPN